MRTKTDIRFDVEADPTQVMEALMAVGMWGEWSPDFESTRIGSRDAEGRAQRVYVQVDTTNPDLQVWEFTWQHSKVNWEISDSTRGIRGSGYFDVSAGDNGSEVLLHVEQSAPVPVPGFLAKKGLRKSYEAMVANFVAYTEGYREPESETYEAVGP